MATHCSLNLSFVKIMCAKTVYLTIQPFRIRLESDFKDTCSRNYLVSNTVFEFVFRGGGGQN